MKRIPLTWDEIEFASMVACKRRIGVMKREGKPRYGASTKELWDMEVLSCIAEMAVAKHFNLYWHPAIGEIDRIDVGDLIEVRARTLLSHRLILHKADDDKLPFVSVVVQPPSCWLIGWLFARNGKRDEWWKDPQRTGRHAYFVPDDALDKDFDELMRLAHSQCMEQSNERTDDQHRAAQPTRLRLVQGQAQR